MTFPVPIFTKLTHIQQNSSISPIPICTQIKKQMWNVWAEINLCLFVKYDFQWQTFHETITKPILVITSCTDFFSKSDEKCRKWANFIYTLNSKYSFHYPNFYKTHYCSTALCGDLLYCILIKLIKKSLLDVLKKSTPLPNFIIFSK